MVVEGRDIGTVVVPDATLKIYLTADAAERAGAGTGMPAEPPASRSRRSRASVDGGRRHPLDLAAVALDLHRRDTKDSTRRTPRCRPRTDAVVIDSSELAVDETVVRVLALAAERGVP